MKVLENSDKDLHSWKVLLLLLDFLHGLPSSVNITVLKINRIMMKLMTKPASVVHIIR